MDFSNTAKVRLLTPTEEKELGFKIQKWIQQENPTPQEEKEGKTALETLVKHNMGLVHKAALSVHNTGFNLLPMEDLVQDGIIGLITAAKKFEPQRGYKFSTMAYNWIYQSISRSINKTGRLIRLPENQIFKNIKIKKEIEKLVKQGYCQETATVKTLKKINMTRESYDNITNANSIHDSLNRQVGNTKESSEVGELILENKNNTPLLEDQVVSSQLLNKLYESLNKLPLQEKRIISAHFQLNGETEEQRKLLKETISPYTYRKIITNAIEIMKETAKNQNIKYEDCVNYL